MNELIRGAMLAWIAWGIVAGLLVRLLVPGRESMSWLGALLAGVGGAFVGGLIAYLLKLGTEPFTPGGWILAIVGAGVALLFYQQLAGARRRTA
jgi:uncharacterized membrane protein YeaQ/YmgE (transglycosylase-associated protein family)